jgi:hypothetical protein
MHTVILVAGGFAMLALFAFAGRAFGGANGIAIAAILFLPVWAHWRSYQLVRGGRDGRVFR